MGLLEHLRVTEAPDFQTMSRTVTFSNFVFSNLHPDGSNDTLDMGPRGTCNGYDGVLG
jgi:hypothetical protein